MPGGRPPHRRSWRRPGEWAIHVAAGLGADEYRNPSGGRDLLDPDRFEAAGVELSFHEHANIVYDTEPFDLVSDLSVIDPLMWLGIDGVRRLR